MRKPAFLSRPVLDPVAQTARGDVIQRTDAEPLEGTRMSLFNSIIPNFWAQNGLSPSSTWWPADGRLAERVWVANRCIQMNAQQIASMPIHFEGTTEPAWVSSPDPSLFPNGIGDAVFSIVAQMYGWGFACLYVTGYYADGYPQFWTVLDSCAMSIKFDDSGQRVYRIGETTLDPRRVVQIDRNPGTAAHGCSALRAYAQQAWGLLAAGNTSMAVSQGAVPFVYLKSQRKLTSGQATELQAEWMEKTQNRNGAPPVLPPEIDVNELHFNPADMALLESQEFNAKALATAYGVPAPSLNMALAGGLTYQNPGALGEMWWRFELRNTSTRVMDAMSAQMLPRGQYVWQDARDTFIALDPTSDTDDEQASVVANASPGPQPGLSVIGGSG
jgi:Phage portal protein